nr:SH3 domain-containing protein [Nesterenkonia sp. YGD6]
MPTQGASTAHLGQDLGAADGSPIYSVAAGTVVRAFSGNRYNTGFVVVQHQINGRTFHSAYLHMWDAHTHVRVGQAVQAGQTISRVGSSGASTGPHLHLEIWEGAWMHGTSHNPTTWLAQRGVDLRASASFVMNITNPSACNYWTVNSTPLRATASSTGSVIMQLGAGATLTAAPGDTSNGMVRVNANGRIGWVAHSSLTPSRPAGGGTVPAANVPQGTSITPTQYRTTAALNGRSGPGTNYAVLQGLTSGTTVTVTATHGGWMKFTRNGQSVWSHSDFLDEVVAPTVAASGTYKVKSGVSLRARSGASTSSSIVKVLDPGTTVSVTGRSGDWFSYRDGSQTLWLQGSFLDQVSSASASNTVSASGTYRVKSGVSLRARSGASTSSSIVKVLNPGTQVSITGRNGIWVSYRDGSQTLWLQESFLDQVSSASASNTVSASGTYRVKSGVSLRARSGASTSSSIVKVLNPGTQVSITGRNGIWVSYRDGSQTLWLQESFLDQVSSASASNTVSASGTYRVKSGVSLRARSGASTSSSIVKVLNPGTQVSITGRNGIWVSYRDGSQTLWLMESFLAQAHNGTGSGPESSSSTPVTSSGIYTVNSGVNLNARTGASTTSSSVKVLAPGTRITVTGEQNEWVSFRDGSRTLWVHSDYLTQVTASADTSSTTAASGTYQVQSGVSLRARSGASTSSSIVKVLNPGTQVSITGRDGIWVSYRDGSQTLWLMESFLTQATASSGAGSSSADTSSTTAASGSYAVKSGINLNARTGPSATSSSAQVLAPGTTISITGKNGEWVSYQDGSRTLWVHSDYLTQVTASADTSSTTAASGTYQVQSGVSLRARSGASTSSSIVKVLNPGTQVSITGRDGIWVSYRDGSQTLWLMESFLTQATASSGAGSSSADTSSTTAASGTYQVQSGVSLRARSGASTSSSIVKVLNPGTQVSITGRDGIWVSYRDGSQTLWLMESFLTQATASSGTGSSSADTSSTTAASGSYAVKSGINLNARTGPSATSSSAQVLAPGTTISITGKNGEWVSYQDGSRTLWVHSDYLTQVTASADTSSTTAASGTYQVQSGVSLRARSGASTSSSIVKVLNPGTQVNITGRDGIWVSYRDGSQTLWLQESFLDRVTASASSGSTTGSTATTAASGTFEVKSGVNLNARTGASATSSSAKVLAPGTKITITGKNGEWVSFQDGSRTLWVHSAYLTQVAASAPTGSTSANTGTTVSASGTYRVKSGVSLRARSGASTSSSIVKVLNPGTQVSITGRDGIWVSYRDGSQTLWLQESFLDRVTASADTSAPTNSGSSSSTSASGTYHVKPNVYLNARSGPGTSHQVVLNLNPLRQFEITGRSGGWVSFVFSGQTVWVDSTYINAGAAGSSGSSSTGSSSSTPTLANSTNSTSKVVGTAFTTAQVNVRMGPSTENSTMFSVRTGTKVELLEKKTTGWQEVKVNGATGWMSAQFLSTSAPATSGSTTGGSTTGSSGSGTSTAPSTSNMHTKSSNGPYSSAWDKLAQCESGGNWKINTGNGFYGGIQFSPESWKEVGGSGFPHQATRAEQIKRGHMLWKKQGWNAWPHCTSQLGLKGDPGGYGDDYYKVHPSAKTVSSVSAAGTWTASYSVPLREEASTSSDKLVQVPRGTELKQLQREGSWLKVQHKVGGDSYTGWVNTSYISQA